MKDYHNPESVRCNIINTENVTVTMSEPVMNSDILRDPTNKLCHLPPQQQKDWERLLLDFSEVFQIPLEGQLQLYMMYYLKKVPEVSNDVFIVFLLINKPL